MNGPKVALACGFLIAVGMLAFPPWLFVFDPPGPIQAERSAGYHFLFANNDPTDITALYRIFGVAPEMIRDPSLPSPTKSDLDEINRLLEMETPTPTPETKIPRYRYPLYYFSIKVDWLKLSVQIGAVAVLTVLAYFILKRKAVELTP